MGSRAKRVAASRAGLDLLLDIGTGTTVRYPSVRTVGRAFAPDFAVRRTGGLGVLVPPTYAEEWARRHPALVERLDRWERRIEDWPLVPRLGDHYLLELERR